MKLIIKTLRKVFVVGRDQVSKPAWQTLRVKDEFVSHPFQIGSYLSFKHKIYAKTMSPPFPYFCFDRLQRVNKMPLIGMCGTIQNVCQISAMNVTEKNRKQGSRAKR
jgi:hypothetical protein